MANKIESLYVREKDGDVYSKAQFVLDADSIIYKGSKLSDWLEKLQKLIDWYQSNGTGYAEMSALSKNIDNEQVDMDQLRFLRLLKQLFIIETKEGQEHGVVSSVNINSGVCDMEQFGENVVGDNPMFIQAFTKGDNVQTYVKICAARILKTQFQNKGVTQDILDLQGRESKGTIYYPKDDNTIYDNNISFSQPPAEQIDKYNSIKYHFILKSNRFNDIDITSEFEDVLAVYGYNGYAELDVNGAIKAYHYFTATDTGNRPVLEQNKNNTIIDLQKTRVLNAMFE